MNKRNVDESLVLTVSIRIFPTNFQAKLLVTTLNEYIQTINKLVAAMISGKKNSKMTTKDVVAKLPSALKNQAIRDTKSVFSKYRKTKKQSILRKPVSIWNNQNYKIDGHSITFPVLVEGKSKRIQVRGIVSDYHKKLLKHKLGTMRVVQKDRKWFAQISVELEHPQERKDGKTMGVDLGIKVPAVAQIEKERTRFFGNGRANKFTRRLHAAVRKALGKAGKVGIIARRNNKEQRWMCDQDHKVSRAIVNFALAHNVSVIKLENLKAIRSTTRTSRKNKKEIHKWSFYRLAKFIVYKARMVGMKILFVNPKNTSKKCPVCQTLNNARGRMYGCKCGFKSHRDRVGAMNIVYATVVDGIAYTRKIHTRGLNPSK